jgi:integrase
VKTKASKGPLVVPELVRPIIEAWKRIAPDTNPEALMFPTFGRGERKGELVPYASKNFLRMRIRPVAERLRIPGRLVTFQVMRRTLGTDLQKHGTLKDAQGALRHASIRTTADIYMQVIDRNVLEAMNARTATVLGDWMVEFDDLGRVGRQPRAPENRRVNSEVFPSCPNLEEAGRSKLLM